MTDTIAAKVDPRTKEKLEERAWREGASISSLVRRLVERYLDEEADSVSKGEKESTLGKDQAPLEDLAGRVDDLEDRYKKHRHRGVASEKDLREISKIMEEMKEQFVKLRDKRLFPGKLSEKPPESNPVFSSCPNCLCDLEPAIVKIAGHSWGWPAYICEHCDHYLRYGRLKPRPVTRDVEVKK